MCKKFIHIVFILVLYFPVSSAAKPLSQSAALARFEQTRAEIDTQRNILLKKYRNARSVAERGAVHREAEKYIAGVFYNYIAPAWLGMPWTMAVIDDGLKPDARIPYEKGKGISCSWFVVSALENMGVKFGNPRGFAGTIAVHLQQSLSPQKKDLKRFFHVSPDQLKKKFIKWGDGLYIIGLNCHVGFVHVQGNIVTFIHADYTNPMQVVMEPIEVSEAIELSEEAGYVVSALFKDDRLIHHWLTGTKVYFNGPRK
ncbi:MAG: hypothetical protein JXX29_12545 [Deltaproteobacteria bacterium]|nr:hypothetical protein [Deltaproteobacteria bacterium]MBN2672504.1 hypothetical protein [Deltaproteobacteria bacterium]